MTFTLTSCHKEETPIRTYEATIFSNCSGKQIYAVIREGKTVATITNKDIETEKAYVLQSGDEIQAQILPEKDHRMTIAIWSGSENIYQDEIELIHNEWKRFNFVLP